MARGRGKSAENHTAAASAGRATYQGKPCIHGHSGTRYIGHRGCVDCARQKAAKRREVGTAQAGSRAWDKRNPELRYTYTKAWKARHPERARLLSRAHWHLRRARKIAAEGSCTREELYDLLERQGGRCAYCGTEHGLTVDHKTPLSRGGSNFIVNIQWLCGSDNSRKKDRTDAEYRQLVGLPEKTEWDA